MFRLLLAQPADWPTKRDDNAFADVSHFLVSGFRVAIFVSASQFVCLCRSYTHFHLFSVRAQHRSALGVDSVMIIAAYTHTHTSKSLMTAQKEGWSFGRSVGRRFPQCIARLAPLDDRNCKFHQYITFAPNAPASTSSMKRTSAPFPNAEQEIDICPHSNTHPAQQQQ